MSRPNLTPLTLVSVLACVLGGRSGLTRRATLADLPHRLATSARACSSASLSTLNRKTLFSRAVADLGVGLADAGKDDLVAAAAGLESAIQLAAAGDIEAGAVPRP